MTTLNQKIYGAAERLIGTDEIAGAADNPLIVKMFEAVGHSWVKDDETPWCAAFVGAVLADCGVKGTGRLNAKSYLDWGERVIGDVHPGDVAVFTRGRPDGPFGHVAFIVDEADTIDHPDLEPGKIRVLGGNQGDTVSIANYPLDRLLTIRRAPGGLVDDAPEPEVDDEHITRQMLATMNGRIQNIERMVEAMHGRMVEAMRGESA